MSRISINTLCSDSLDNGISYKYTDVEDPSCTEKLLNSFNLEKELQFLRQAWCTDDSIENYWFLDDKGTILQLDRFNFTVLEKTDEVHDWKGDKYHSVSVSPRSEVITNKTVKYGVTNVNAVAGNVQGAIKAYFWCIELASTTSMLFKFYSFENNHAVLIREYTIELCKKFLGEELIGADVQKLNTYSDINVSDFIFDAQYSATSIYGHVLFGVHVDNNFNQWTINFNLNQESSFTVIQGYGFVGMDGTLTGGEIPATYFDTNKGFNATVYSLDTLDTNSDDRYIKDISELYSLDSKVVGTDVQQWYIGKNVKNIVSHLVYNARTNTFGAVLLPINNNYAVTYASSSFYTKTLTDANIITEQFTSYIFGEGMLANAKGTIRSTISTVVALLGNPNIYLLFPKMSTSGYLQQALGQYAYVHYNSNSIKQFADVTKENKLDNIDTTVYNVNEDDDNIDISKHKASMINTDELSFNTMSVKQQVVPDNKSVNWGSVLSQLAFISLQNITMSELTVNKSQQQTATSDIGRKYGQMFLQNMSSMGSTDMLIRSLSPSMTSIVTSVLTLDMFYSTCDKQHIHAGPGYVNHNFVAQCVAQSITSNQFELNQVSIKHCIKEATLYRSRLIYQGLKYARERYMQKVGITGSAGTWAMGTGGNVGSVIGAIALLLLQALIDITIYGYECAIELASGILDAAGGNETLSNITAQSSRHTYDIEGKHKYGAKTESFMYPCWGCDTPKVYSDEGVLAQCVNNPWSIHQSKKYNGGYRLSSRDDKTLEDVTVPFVTKATVKAARLEWNSDKVPYYTANCKSKMYSSTLPSGMAYIIGAESFLSTVPFKNENVDCGEPVFPTPIIQDYIIDKDWQLSQTATGGATVWVSCKDTKLIDGEPSNMVVTPWFCGVASPYAAIEVRHGIDKQYIRPWAVTPEVLALNNTGKNAIYKHKMYHAFDGIGYRVVNWVGCPGMNKEYMNLHYCFQVNDKFKRSNKLPPNQLLGNFNASPIVAVETDVEDKLYNDVTMPSKGKGLEAGVVGEDKDVLRYSLPIFTEFVTTLPATVKALAPYKLAVVDGVTSLCTDLRNTQSAYKAPESVDFTIGKSVYRMTPEYICSVTTQNGVVVTEDLVPALGLTYIGSTPFEAFFYSQATRQYYTYTGGTNLQKVDMLERFRDIQKGRYDFINQEVVMQCLATFDRLDDNVHDDEDETDNIMCLILKDSNVIGELPPPITTIFDTESWFRILSLPCGVVYQGPNRCIINRFTYSDYMKNGIVRNKGNWEKVPREEYHPFRVYKKQFQSVTEQIGPEVVVRGWTHNPFLLVTSPLGVASEVDCIFEWEITFAWTTEMDSLYAENEYACVCIQGETMTPGGKVVSPRPTHVFLSKELFTRSGNVGYYSFRYQSKNGAGNRERIHIWADSYIAVSSIQCEYKEFTSKRNEQLVIQADVQDMKEM